MSPLRGATQPNTAAPLNFGDSPPRFWVVLVVTGAGAGIGGGVLMLLLHATQHAAYGYHSGFFQAGVARASVPRRLLVLAVAGLVLGGGWALLRRRYGAGTGLSRAVWTKAGRLGGMETTLNAVLQILAVGAGASLGREGAPKEIGAAVGSALARPARLSLDHRRLLVACGAGAGMAAVYNVPLGGALFAAEVLLGTLTLSAVLPALICAAVATGVSWLLLPDQPTYSVPPLHTALPQIVWAVLLGPLVGVVAVGYVRLIGWAKARSATGFRLVGRITVVFVGVAAIGLAFPQLLGNGRDIAQLALQARVTLPLLWVVFVLKPVATAACLRGGAAGGLFTPTLATGAALGAATGQLWLHLWVGGTPGGYAMIGAAALLAGAMQSPVASVVLMLELAHHGWSLLVPMLLAVGGSTWTARRLDGRSIYSVTVPAAGGGDRPPAGTDGVVTAAPGGRRDRKVRPPQDGSALA